MGKEMLCCEHTRVVVVSATPCSPRSPSAPGSNAFTDSKGKNLRYTQAAQVHLWASFFLHLI